MWITDPTTKEILKYLNDFAEQLVENHSVLFRNAVEVNQEDFHRDTERYQTLMDIVNLAYEDIEEFYDTVESHMGESGGSARRH